MATQFRQEKTIKIYFYILASLFFLSAFIFNPIGESLEGLLAIVRQEGVLLTDYFYIAGIGGTLLNVSLVLFVTLAIIEKAKVRLSGLAFAAIFILAGFSLFGKNIYNILPVYLGVFLYSRYVKEDLKNFFLIAIFGTCLAPIAGANIIDGWAGFVLSFAIGLLYGFVLVPLASHMSRFHNGYTLYNVGFSAGLFALVAVAILRSLGFEFNAANYISDQFHYQLTWISLLICFSFIVLSFVVKEHEWKDYKGMMGHSGRAVTDFFILHEPSMVYFNIGLMGILATIIAVASGVPMNGPNMGGVFTILGFAAFGKHPKNCFPVVFGAFLMFLITGATMTTGTVLTLLFVTGLAPIAGQYGLIWGIITGILHYSLMNFSGAWQGALNLYNNGFVSGIVAGFLVNIIDNLKKED